MSVVLRNSQCPHMNLLMQQTLPVSFGSNVIIQINICCPDIICSAHWLLLLAVAVQGPIILVPRSFVIFLKFPQSLNPPIRRCAPLAFLPGSLLLLVIVHIFPFIYPLLFPAFTLLSTPFLHLSVVLVFLPFVVAPHASGLLLFFCVHAYGQYALKLKPQ